jgi:redox-sensitive bicupin YhaK (pirin superfamily)
LITLRSAETRGHANHGWLDSHHTFSFGSYYDPNHVGLGDLRVINDDRVIGGGGFATHGHRDMEIISYVVEGALAHKDSMGNGSIIRPNEVQVMSAGRGVTHSEMNPSDTETVNFLQVWVIPATTGTEPSYQQRDFGRDPGLHLVVSKDGRDGSLKILQDAAMYRGIVGAGDTVTHPFIAGRRGYLQLVRGRLDLHGQTLVPGDGAAIGDTTTLKILANEDAEFLLFDLR